VSGLSASARTRSERVREDMPHYSDSAFTMR
jgi:hypothetical protein